MCSRLREIHLVTLFAGLAPQQLLSVAALHCDELVCVMRSRFRLGGRDQAQCISTVAELLRVSGDVLAAGGANEIAHRSGRFVGYCRAYAAIELQLVARGASPLVSNGYHQP